MARLRDKPEADSPSRLTVTHRWRPRWSDAALLGAAAFAVPLEIMASNLVGLTHPERLLAIGFFELIVGLGVLSLFGIIRLRRNLGLAVTLLVFIGFNYGGVLLKQYGSLLGLAIVLFLVAGFGLIARRASDAILRPVLVALAVFLLASPAFRLYRSLDSWGDDVSLLRQSDIELVMARQPDIFLVVLDGYAGRVSARRDQAISHPQWSASLAELGFRSPSSAWSSYPTTTASLTSLLEMSYVLHSGAGISPATQMALYETIAGDNALVRALRSAGYRITMLESGWSGSSCGPLVDVCIPSPLMDEATFRVLNQTILWPAVLEHFGYSFTVGARGVMTWMLENGERIASDARPDLVFAHVMAPHPPFFLDADCSLVFSVERSGVTFTRARDDVAARELAYLEQTSCVDGFMTELARTLPSTSAIVFTADHGTDRRNQLVQPPEDWDEPELSERFNVLLSVRIPGCEFGEVVLLPNLFRRLLSCLATDELDDLPPRMFVYSSAQGEPSSILEVEHQVVASLLESGTKPLDSTGRLRAIVPG